MADTIQGLTGRQNVADGVFVSPRLNSDKSMMTSLSRARFEDAVNEGHVYGVCNQAGVTSQAGLSATTPVLTLYNPLGSGVNAVVWFAGATFSVAFAAASAVWVAVGTNTAAAAVTGTLTTAHRNLKLGLQSNNACQAHLAATLPATPVGICLLGMGLTGAITTIPQLQTLGRWFDGGLVLTPGTNMSIQTSTASGASGTFCEFIWQEVPAAYAN